MKIVIAVDIKSFNWGEVGATRQGLTRALFSKTRLPDITTDNTEESPLQWEGTDSRSVWQDSLA